MYEIQEPQIWTRRSGIHANLLTAEIANWSWSFIEEKSDPNKLMEKSST